jgi:hypothetical protein
MHLTDFQPRRRRWVYHRGLTNITRIAHYCHGWWCTMWQHSRVVHGKSHYTCPPYSPRKMTTMPRPTQLMLLLHLRVSLSLYVLLKWASWEWESLQRLLPPFKGEHLEGAWTSPPYTYLPWGKIPTFPQGWLKTSSAHGYLHYDWVDHRW